MHSSEEFKRQFSFLESNFALPLRLFKCSPEHFGNIVAEYGTTNCYVRLVRDRGLVETSISPDGSSWRPLDSFLTELGHPASVKAVYRDDHDYFGRFSGNTAAEQALALQAHLPAIQRHLVGA